MRLYVLYFDTMMNDFKLRIVSNYNSKTTLNRYVIAVYHLVNDKLIEDKSYNNLILDRRVKKHKRLFGFLKKFKERR